MSGIIYLEGGGSSHDLRSRCQKAFRQLLERCGFAGRMPRLVACGGREHAFSDFQIAIRQPHGHSFVGLWIDSEDPLADLEDTWGHLKRRDNWECPSTASNEQVLFMTTCMETWIVADRSTMTNFYGSGLQESALPHSMTWRPGLAIRFRIPLLTRRGIAGIRIAKESDPTRYSVASTRTHWPSTYPASFACAGS